MRRRQHARALNLTVIKQLSMDVVNTTQLFIKT